MVDITSSPAPQPRLDRDLDTPSPSSRSASAYAYEISSSGSASPTAYFARPATPQRASLTPFRISPPNNSLMAGNSLLKTPRYPRTLGHGSMALYGSARTLSREDLAAVLEMRVLGPAQKELAVRVFDAAMRVKEWCREIEDWGWSGRWEEHGVRNDGQNLESEEIDNEAPQPKLDAHFEEHSSRLDQISADLAALEIDELKEHALGIHLSRSRPGSSYSGQSLTPSKLQLYNDFELFVTQAVVQSLPPLETLRRALQTWSIRLLVLRELPAFLISLTAAQNRMQTSNTVLQETTDRASALEYIGTLEAKIRDSSSYFERRIPDLGTKLDRMLDAVEGGEDQGTLPGQWIDDFETLEADYGVFASDAQRKLIELQFLQISMQEPRIEPTAENDSKEPTSQAPEGVETLNTDELGPKLESNDNGYFNQEVNRQPLQFDGQGDIPEPSTHAAPDASISDYVNSIRQGSDIDSSEERGDSLFGRSTSDRQENQTEGESEDLALADGEDSGPRRSSAVGREATIIRRASITSVESFKRGQVKTLHIRRHSRASSRSGRLSIDGDAPTTPLPSSPLAKRTPSWSTQPSSPLSMTTEEPKRIDAAVIGAVGDGEEVRLQSTPLREEATRRDSMSSVSSIPSAPTSPSQPMEDSPSAGPRQRLMSKVPKPPLNGMIHKKRQSLPNVDVEASAWPADNEFATQQSSNFSEKSPAPKSATMPLQEQISEIITALPTRIHLASSPSSPTNPAFDPKSMLGSSPLSNSTPPHGVKSHKRRSSLQDAFMRLRGSSHKHHPHGLTLSPVDDAGTRKSGANDPEIKLYHLTQPGASKPIKLFIRRVGENGERVMVRVGGGWADLGEYLRAFVEHHSRVVSAGGPAVMSAGDSTPTSTGKNRESGSTTGTPSRAETDSPEPFAASTPRILSNGGDDYAATPSPLLSGFAVTTDTPPTAGTASGSRKASGSPWEDAMSIGLAGPARRAKNRDLSEEKREWVNGVVEQARRTVSGSGAGPKAAEGEEKRSASRLGGAYKKVDIGSLGEAGKATKRVFLRSKE